MSRDNSYEGRLPHGGGGAGASAGASKLALSSMKANGHGHLNGHASHARPAHSASSAGYYSGQSGSEDGALYTVDHLATFTVGESYELVHPQDGLRRLRQMEKSSGIWTQRMYLRVEHNWLVIIDYENGDTVERFPMELVSQPSHFLSQDPKELYNNILLFTVKPDPRSKFNAGISEMHLFHCLKTSAQTIADSITLLCRTGLNGADKSSSAKRKGDNGVLVGAGLLAMSSIPPPPANPPPEPPLQGGVNVKERVDVFNNILGESRNGRPMGRSYLLQEADSESQSQRSDSTSTNYERDVAILNHCFDDIERFIARLQYASAAYKELERRRRQRKSKKKEAGDGMLLVRARPPAEAEFIDILQKFKLSFNLLGKLRSHIHDPNAPELVHFLFTPLALVVDASLDAEYGPSLAGSVVAPLLTEEAKQLLLNCLTSKESDLWLSLGEAWSQSRGHWPGHVPTYQPVFHDGWEPSIDRDLTQAGALYNERLRGRLEHNWKEERDFEQDSNGEYPPYSDYRHHLDSTPSPSPRQYSEKERDRDRHSDFSDGVGSENDYERRQRRFAGDLLESKAASSASTAKLVQVQHARAGRNDKELSVQEGEILEVLNDSRKWWQTRNSRGQVGYVPHTIVRAYAGDTADDAYASGYPGASPSQRSHQRSGGQLSGNRSHRDRHRYD
ncbi:epidermal growth factor receptor kinase substrate 8-like [Paramacrobiotus metropolitanus]|uniref:epidermal growth factor receptor kinase substrate 8-like n=1 Tax=Paramacrobiotus metropolitanus TaxID=2943436 RepID=UPI0024456636|nr:epidermal growth factor receptor kinase substrate 8-like [Paramacrobiotus metropolitanus]XP_055337924.1 epidermal growth factor receptor kinase substrate 8-like [Paramacrobiotus metropolitanus]XP_055337926.1 epidermal growth factor receptor kinase substrate 8-like [Paramacrobiotus metropolitanus]XP_055337927.1 epidermal growth factor receptor kinase substrate 8-like [Paramacrobiotus metropolitanus]